MRSRLMTSSVSANAAITVNTIPPSACSSPRFPAHRGEDRDGQIATRPFSPANGVTLAGEKDVLGLWAGTSGEGVRLWMSVLTTGSKR